MGHLIARPLVMVHRRDSDHGRPGQGIVDLGQSSERCGPRRKRGELPEDYRFHNLHHYYASLLIASGPDVTTVQYRLRHGSATTTLSTYGHPWQPAL